MAELRLLAALVLASSCLPSTAGAQDLLDTFGRPIGDDTAEGGPRGYCFSESAPDSMPPGLFGGLGTTGRHWEITSESAVDDGGLFAERLGVGLARPLSRSLDVILRSAVAGFTYDPVGEDGIARSPIPSVALRVSTRCDGYWIEFGARAVMPTVGGDAGPEQMRLAERGLLAEGARDAAFWLPRHRWGAQIYATARMRSEQLDVFPHLYVALSLGVLLSAGPLTISSWLGDQSGFVGSIWLETWVGVVDLADGVAGNLRLGARAELDLSSVWAAGELLPVTLDGFLGWSGIAPLALEVFFGGGGMIESMAGEPWRYRGGLRASVYFP